MSPKKIPTQASELLFSGLEAGSRALREGAAEYDPTPETREIGRISSLSESIAWITGLGKVKSEELVLVESGGKASGTPGTASRRIPGLVLDVLEDRVGVVLLGDPSHLSAGMEVSRTGRVADVPVGDGLIGRVISPLGEPRDGKGPLSHANAETERWPLERPSPPILHRASVDTPLQTGIKAIDALIPIGRGQRELILGDRQSGKTAVAVDAIANQKGKDVICIYCAIGQRSSSVARVVDELNQVGAMDYTVVVVVEGDEPPGLIYAAPYAGTTMGEYFMEQGRDVLLVYDDLTRHAIAYRQLSLLLRRPPGREAYPGDIFYVHSRLLERSTHMRGEHGGGSLTALPIIETEAQNLSAYIPTNLISITDGQIYLNPDLFQKGILPAVDVGKSVSRVGGKAQHPAYRAVAGDLRLSYSQFQELEAFARFGTRLDEETRQTLEHGRRVREILKQDQLSPLSATQQIGVLWAVAEGYFDRIPLDRIREAETHLTELLAGEPDLETALPQAARPGTQEEPGDSDALWNRVRALAEATVERFAKPETGAA